MGALIVVSFVSMWSCDGFVTFSHSGRTPAVTRKGDKQVKKMEGNCHAALFKRDRNTRLVSDPHPVVMCVCTAVCMRFKEKREVNINFVFG